MGGKQMEKSKKERPRKHCKYCGKLFEQTRPWKAYCSKTCQWREWERNHPRQTLTTTLIMLAIIATLSQAQASEMPGIPVDWQHVENTIIGEGANQKLQGMTAIAEVMRNRGWNLKGFVASRRVDLRQFVARQPAY